VHAEESGPVTVTRGNASRPRSLPDAAILRGDTPARRFGEVERQIAEYTKLKAGRWFRYRIRRCITLGCVKTLAAISCNVLRYTVMRDALICQSPADPASDGSTVLRRESQISL